MGRRAFFSFHYAADAWRASQVRNMGALEGNQPCSDNDWESVTRGGDAAIERWIKDQLAGRSCVVVLIGSHTAGRKWINYEISQGWNEGKGVLGIHVHRLLDHNQSATLKGANPFDHVTFTNSGKTLSTIAKVYDPPGFTSSDAYGFIRSHLADWVEEAIALRNSA